MDINKVSISTQNKRHLFFTKENTLKFHKLKLSPSRLSPKHRKVDSTSTTIENPKISKFINTQLLSNKLKTHSYKRAESELRQILSRSLIREKPLSREKSEENRKSYTLKSLNNTLRPVIRNYSSLKSKEADLIISEYKSITNAKIWDSFIENLRANPKHLLDLIPISLTTKNSKNNPRKLGKLSRTRASKKLDQEKSFESINRRETSCGQTPEVIESLKENITNLTEDWSKSLLHHNIKHNNSNLDMSSGYQSSDLEFILQSSSQEYLSDILQKLYYTVEKLLIELLGTKDDLDKFLEVYNEPIPSVIRALCVKCLDLYRFRNKTVEIVKEVMKREKLVKGLSTGDRKTVIDIHKLSKKIRELIAKWLEDECVPFKKFIYKGEDYVDKMNKDLVMLQEFLIKNS